MCRARKGGEGGKGGKRGEVGTGERRLKKAALQTHGAVCTGSWEALTVYWSTGHGGRTRAFGAIRARDWSEWAGERGGRNECTGVGVFLAHGGWVVQIGHVSERAGCCVWRYDDRCVTMAAASGTRCPTGAPHNGVARCGWRSERAVRYRGTHSRRTMARRAM